MGICQNVCVLVKAYIEVAEGCLIYPTAFLLSSSIFLEQAV